MKNPAFYLIIPVLVLLLLVVSCSGNTKSDKESTKMVLNSSLDGSWYPGDKESLQKQLAGFVEKEKADSQSNVIALILPHAGYSFSGQTAMAAVTTIKKKKYKRVIVIGPSHRWPMENVLSVPDVTHYGSPLGEVPLDLEFIGQLKKHDLFQTIMPVHEKEHSVQIEVPLLQYSLKDFRLVPIVAGQLNQEAVAKTAAILSSMIDSETLVVASSDFTHYGPNYNYVPFKEDVPEKLKQLDMAAYEFIAKLDVAGFFEFHREKNNHICGFVPVTILMNMLGKDCRAKLVRYATSGRITGDFTNSVSYLSITFTGNWAKGRPLKPQTAQLSEKDKQELLKLARGSLEFYLKNEKLVTPEQLGIIVTEPMKQIRATFVTLNKHHRLRGCIGGLYPSEPLYQSVLINAVKAGLADQRFGQVTIEECAELTFEISVLTPPKLVPSYNDIVIGKHGVILSKAGRGAVYLPQVAPEQGWNIEETLTHLSQKAGLAKDAWKEGAQFMVFEAIVFSEK